jgi:Putative transposase
MDGPRGRPRTIQRSPDRTVYPPNDRPWPIQPVAVGRSNDRSTSGFSLHAGIAAKAAQRDELEHLARYVARPPIATERLLLTERGLVRLALKTPYRDGTTHVMFEPDDFMARLAALVPKPRAHLTRYHKP